MLCAFNVFSRLKEIKLIFLQLIWFCGWLLSFKLKLLSYLGVCWVWNWKYCKCFWQSWVVTQCGWPNCSGGEDWKLWEQDVTTVVGRDKILAVNSNKAQCNPPQTPLYLPSSGHVVFNVFGALTKIAAIYPNLNYIFYFYNL